MNREELELMIDNERKKFEKQQYNKQIGLEKARKINNGIESIYKKGLELREDLLKKKVGEEDKTLLERAEEISNENKKMNKKKLVPAREIEVIESKYIEEYNPKYDKLVHFAEKYRIPYFAGGKRKGFKDLAHDIHEFEMRNKKALLKKGVDKKYKEYGLYIKPI